MGTGKGLSANLDLLRSIAVLLVLAQHLLRRAYVDQIGWIQTSSLGYFGVLLFFVHTSLVLMYSLERSQLSGWQLVKNFYVRRIFRIYPLSMLAVLIALGLQLDSDINGIRGLSKGQLPGTLSAMSNLLLVQNLTGVKSIVNVLWSLPFELQMYVFLPILFLWVRRKRMFWPLMGLWTFCAVAGTAQPHLSGLSRFSLLQFVPNFLPGIIAFTLPQLPRIKSYLWPVFILILIAVFTLYPRFWMGWLLCLTLGILIPSFDEIATPWLQTLSNRIATYSYGIYISHQFCIWVALAALGSLSPWIKVPVLITLLVTLPIALYHAIEKPMIRVGQQVAERWSENRAEVATATAS